MRILGLSLLLTLTLCIPVRAAAGVVVERVAPRSAGARAGLQPEDVILSWSCEAASGSLGSPYDLLPLEIEESPRRAVTLRGRRGTEEKVWALGGPPWRIGTRPGLPADLEALYLQGQAGAGAGDLAVAERSWRSAAESLRTAGEARLAAWFLDRLAGLAGAGRWPEADAAYQEALTILEREPERLAASQLLHDWGETFQGRGDWDGAVERYQKALALDPPQSLAAARTLDDLGTAAAKRGRYDAAEGFLRQALAIREELAPGTTLIAASFNKLGVLARLRGDLTTAEELLTRGEEIQRRLAPDSFEHGNFFMNLGNVALNRDDLERAESLHRQALAIFEQIDPEGGWSVSVREKLSMGELRGGTRRWARCAPNAGPRCGGDSSRG
jgi:tetratricopeptide (TPR) repeat protein